MWRTEEKTDGLTTDEQTSSMTAKIKNVKIQHVFHRNSTKITLIVSIHGNENILMMKIFLCYLQQQKKGKLDQGHNIENQFE